MLRSQWDLILFALGGASLSTHQLHARISYFHVCPTQSPDFCMIAVITIRDEVQFSLRYNSIYVIFAFDAYTFEVMSKKSWLRLTVKKTILFF